MKQYLMAVTAVFASLAVSAQEFRVKGELKAFKPVDKVFLNYRNGDDVVRDSAVLTNGNFQFQGKIVEPTVATLVVRYVKGEQDMRAKQEMAQLFLEPASLEVMAKDSLKLVQVKGSKGHTELDKLNKMREQYEPQLKTLYEQYAGFAKAGNKTEQNRLEAEIEQLEERVNEETFGNLLRKQPQSPVALFALQQYAGYDIDATKIEPLFASLPAQVKQYPSAIALKDRIEIAKKTAVGSMAMDFTQNDTLGNPVALSSFRGKYVLVDFWASWCGPCRAENPNVVKTFNKYKDKGFTVLGVSLDRPTAKDRWLKAIHDDGLAWTQVSDLKYWDNAVAKQYGIRAIPQNILVDPSGKIVGRNLRGEALEKKLAEILN